MNKAEIRPLLVEALAQAKLQEEVACEQIQREKAAGWSVAAAQLEAWRAARLKRAQAELQLWLADRQWEREELQEIIQLVQEEKEGAAKHKLPFPPASPDSKD